MSFDFPASPSVGATYSPGGGPTYVWDGAGWAVNDAAIPISGYYKLAEGTLGASASAIIIPFPAGYRFWEFHCRNVKVNTLSGINAQISVDGGATYPALSNSYYYMYDTIGVGNAQGNWVAAAGTATIMIVWPAVDAGVSGATGRIKFSNPAPAEPTHMEAVTYGYWGAAAGSNYRAARSYGHPSGAGGGMGTPTHVRFSTGAGLLTAFDWQLNGIK